MSVPVPVSHSTIIANAIILLFLALNFLALRLYLRYFHHHHHRPQRARTWSKLFNDLFAILALLFVAVSHILQLLLLSEPTGTAYNNNNNNKKNAFCRYAVLIVLWSVKAAFVSTYFKLLPVLTRGRVYAVYSVAIGMGMSFVGAVVVMAVTEKKMKSEMAGVAIVGALHLASNCAVVGLGFGLLSQLCDRGGVVFVALLGGVSLAAAVVRVVLQVLYKGRTTLAVGWATFAEVGVAVCVVSAPGVRVLVRGWMRTERVGEVGTSRRRRRCGRDGMQGGRGLYIVGDLENGGMNLQLKDIGGLIESTASEDP